MRGALEEVLSRKFWNVKVGKLFSSGNRFPFINQLYSTGSNNLDHQDEKTVETESRLTMKKMSWSIIDVCPDLGMGDRGVYDICLPFLY